MGYSSDNTIDYMLISEKPISRKPFQSTMKRSSRFIRESLEKLKRSTFKIMFHIIWFLASKSPSRESKSPRSQLSRNLSPFTLAKKGSRLLPKENFDLSGQSWGQGRSQRSSSFWITSLVPLVGIFSDRPHRLLPDGSNEQAKFGDIEFLWCKKSPRRSPKWSRNGRIL